MSDTTPREDRADDEDGRGSEGTIPDSDDGIAVGVSGEQNTFEPEEDPEAANAPE